MQVLVVTHSPQVAARGGAHMRAIVEATGLPGEGCDAGIEQLDALERREEIARMLAGETVTEAASGGGR